MLLLHPNIKIDSNNRRIITFPLTEKRKIGKKNLIVNKQNFSVLWGYLYEGKKWGKFILYNVSLEKVGIRKKKKTESW